MEEIKRRKSRQRDAVIEYLKSTTTHPTADAVYEELKKTNPNISLGTVYRNLRLLAEEGEALELSVTPEKVHFDGNVSPHSHFVCEKCGEIFDVFDDEFTVPKSLQGKLVKNVATTYYGVCERCKNK